MNFPVEIVEMTRRTDKDWSFQEEQQTDCKKLNI
jgi:hypothetical protein